MPSIMDYPDYIILWILLCIISGGGTGDSSGQVSKATVELAPSLRGRDACRHGRRAAADLPRAHAHSSAEAAGVYDDDRDNVGSSSGAATLTPYTSYTQLTLFRILTINNTE